MSPLRGLLRRRSRSDGVSAVLAGVASAAAAEVEANLPTPVDPTAAAFFDVDNTVMQGASIYYFAKGLAARKFFTSRDLARFAWREVRFRVSGESLQHMAKAREAALAFVAGHNVEEVVALCEDIYDEMMAERIWSGTRALAEQHLASGQRVWLVTATPVELARIISSRLALTGALGTVSEIEDGIYTGQLVGEPLHGPAKAEAIRALAEREGLDLARCSAYSDSMNDLPMLALVGYPTVINPDPDLAAEARRRGWPVRDYRTGRKVARVGIPVAAGVGALSGAALAGVAINRRTRSVPGRPQSLVTVARPPVSTSGRHPAKPIRGAQPVPGSARRTPTAAAAVVGRASAGSSPAPGRSG